MTSKLEDQAQRFFEELVDTQPRLRYQSINEGFTKNVFKAGHAACRVEAQRIWRKPSERPRIGSDLLIVRFEFNEPKMSRVQLPKDKDDWDFYRRRISTMATWTYLSDFLKLLPDWATEAGERNPVVITITKGCARLSEGKHRNR